MANREFSVDLGAFIRKAKANADLVVNKVVFSLGTSIVMRSPVGDGSLWKNPPPKGYIGGRFRANWMYSFTAEPTEISDAIDRTGQTSITRLSAIPADAAGKVHMIRNNLPYSVRLETGWSKQAPGGMVSLAVREFKQYIRSAVKDLK